MCRKTQETTQYKMWWHIRSQQRVINILQAHDHMSLNIVEYKQVHTLSTTVEVEYYTHAVTEAC